MLVFAAAADVTALRRAVAALAGPATSMNYSDELPREESGDAERTSVTVGAARGAFKHDTWIFASASDSCSLLSEMPDSLRHLSPAQYQMASVELRQWKHLLSHRHVPQQHTRASCTIGHATRDNQVNDTTVRARTSTAATGNVDNLLFCQQRVDTVSSAECTGHLSLLWARVPHTTSDAEFADFGATRSPACAAPDGVADSSLPSRHHLLCVDVGGMYLPISWEHPVAERTQNAPPQPAESAATKAACASRRPNAVRIVHGHAQPKQTSFSDAHCSSTRGMTDEREAEVSQSLWRVLQERFTAATRSCPFRPEACATASPLTLTEVWVVPLLTADNDNDEPLNSATLAISAFPKLVDEKYQHNSADFVSVNGDGVRSFRLARHPPTHVLRIAGDDDARLTNPLSFATCQASVLGSRKRHRDKTTGGGDGADERQWLTTHVTHPLQDAVFLRACSCDCGSTDTAPPELPAVRLRILERGFLLRSCYFSEWCCTADFDITGSFLSPYLGKRTRSTTSHHAFYSALRRCVLAEDALVQHMVEKEAAKLVASCESPSGADVSSTSGVAAPQQSTTEEGLFKDSTLEGGSAGDTGAHGSERVWPVEELWNLWVRLEWIPPLTWQRVRVRLQFSEGLGPGKVRRCCIRELSPRALLGFLSRVATAVNVAYIEAKQLRQIDDSRANCVTADAEGDDDAVGADLGGVIDVSLADSRQRNIPFSLAARRESLVQVRRLLEFRAALPVAAELVTRQLSVGPSDVGIAAPCIPTVDPHPITAFRDVAVGSPALSAAARDLAADIAATTVLSASHPAASPAGSAADVATFAMAWLRGVLESPALLLPPLGVSGEMDERDSAEGSSCGARIHFSSRSAVDKETATLTALLARRSPFQPEKSLQDGLEVSMTSYPLPILPPSSLSAAEMYCEAADVAELRWSSPEPTATTDYHAAFSAAASKTPAPGAPSSAFGTESCCAVACEEVARLARTKTATEIANVFRTSHQQLSATNPLAAFLYTRCVRYLQEQGVLTVMSPSGEGCGERDLSDPGRDDESVSRDSCAAPQSAAAASCSLFHSLMPQQGGCGQGGAAGVSLPENGDCLEDESGPSGEGDAVNTLLAETVVRVVQQNKSVVRRILALIQSYSCVLTEATAEVNSGAPLVSNTHRAAAAESTDRQPKDAVAQDLWHCLVPERNAAMRVNGAVGQPSSCAKATAQRLLQAFWTNVAATARLHLCNQLDASSSSEVDSTSDSEEEEEELAGGSPSLPTRRGGAVCLPAEAAASTYSELQHGFIAKQSGANSKVTKSSISLPSSREQAHTSPAFPLLSPTLLSRQLPSPIPATHPSGVSIQAVRGLDGAKAMALYVQHILRCFNSTGHQQSQTQLGSCPLPSCATEAPWRAPPTMGDTAASHDNPWQPNYWLHHALFLLSYGLACPPDQSAVSTGAATTPADACSKGCHFVCSCSGDDQFALPPPPALAAFRTLRCGKLTLDAWIGAALEVYLQRWELSIQAQ
ncbi:hypothetical protein Q4I30_007444 [Leishmania utingensis]|uniref:Uncharacterized protein n=1 Tax=Leishmania utingensis TaxID=653362 RepID=A0AAW2ZZC7_9TRYP